MNGKRERIALETDINEPPKKQARNNAYEQLRQQLQQELEKCDAILLALEKPKEDVNTLKEESKEEPMQVEHEPIQPEPIQQEIIQQEIIQPEPIHHEKKSKRKESPKHTRSSSPTSFATPSTKSKSKDSESSTRRSKRPRKPAKSYDESSDQPQLSNDLKKARKIVDAILKHKQAWPFSEPVDTVKLGLTDYLDIVKHPMDFGTISQKIDDNDYTSYDEFIADCNLVFSNCFLYNPPKTDVCVMGETVKKYFDKKVTSYRHESSTKKSTTPAKSDLVSDAPQQEQAASTPAAAHPKRSGKKEQSKKRMKTTSPIDSREMSYDEKRRLSSNIGKLDADKISKVIEIIASRAPKASSQTEDSDEIEIDLDKLDAVTLRQLERFVRSSLHEVVKSEKKSTRKRGKKGAKAGDQVGTADQKTEKTEEGTESSSDSDDSESSDSDSESEEEKMLPATLPISG